MSDYWCVVNTPATLHGWMPPGEGDAPEHFAVVVGACGERPRFYLNGYVQPAGTCAEHPDGADAGGSSACLRCAVALRMSGKGSNRRNEDTAAVEANWDAINWNTRDAEALPDMPEDQGVDGGTQGAAVQNRGR